ncbi:MAG: autotransporter-associated beta strand repeat-containing protein [Kiritimatiellae bacterium]|nr:autotransporter-associated beta strand repeat-containing protein [Kiritimatiellia bacterium]
MGLIISVTTTYASGTSTIAGTLRVGTTDQTATCWVIAEGGTLRVDGAIARYGSGGGATRKEGDGTLELNTGTSKVNALIINGGTVRAINGCGGVDAIPLTLTKGTYDMNGNSIKTLSLSGTTQSRVVNNEATDVVLTCEFQGNQTIGTYLSGNFRVNYTHNGTSRVLTLTNPTNDYTGSTTIKDGNTLVLQADSPLGAPGCLGLSASAVIMGEQSGNGGGSSAQKTSVLSDGPYIVGQSFDLGTHKPFKQLGATAGQVGTSTFSGNIRVGAGSAYNGDNPHLYIVAGADAVVNFTGNITNTLGKIGTSGAVRNGKVFMLGEGVARLSGDNTYKGGTIVSNGTLIAASPTALSTAGATVARGVLGGTATVLGAVSVESGAALTGGEVDGAGTLTLNSGLTLDSGSKLLIQVEGASADCVLVAGGTLAVTSPVTVDVDILADPTLSKYPILDWSGSASGAPALTDFEVGAGAEDYMLKIEGSALYLRPRKSAGTVIILE